MNRWQSLGSAAVAISFTSQRFKLYYSTSGIVRQAEKKNPRITQTGSQSASGSKLAVTFRAGWITGGLREGLLWGPGLQVRWWNEVFYNEDKLSWLRLHAYLNIVFAKPETNTLCYCCPVVRLGNWSFGFMPKSLFHVFSFSCIKTWMHYLRQLHFYQGLTLED